MPSPTRKQIRAFFDKNKKKKKHDEIIPKIIRTYEISFPSSHDPRKTAYIEKTLGQFYKEQRNVEREKLKIKYLCKDTQEERLYNSAKQSAKKRNIPFNIELTDIDVPEQCPLLGIKLTNTLGKGRIASNASIDRIDNSKGYVLGNVWVISEAANRMKNDASIEELLTFAENVLSHFSIEKK